MLMFKTIIKEIIEWILLIFGFLYWIVFGFSISLVSRVLYVILPPKKGILWGQYLLQKMFVVFIGYLKITHLLQLEDKQLSILAKQKGAAIIAPNHTALWDAIFIAHRIPDILCIMKGSILKNPILGGGARLAGYIPNNSTSQMLKLAISRLQAQDRLLIFPEGTRTKTEAQWLNPLKGGTALLAKHSGAPVIPIFIRSNTRFFEKGWPLYKKPKFPLKISIHVAEPVWIEKNESSQAFTQRLEQLYLKELSSPHRLQRIPYE